VPAWLSDRDRPWLRDLLAEAAAAAGRPVAALAARWRRSEPDPRAGPRMVIAQHVLLGLLRSARPSRGPRALRRTLFHLAAQGLPRERAIAAAAQVHGLRPDDLLAQLFADLPGERRVHWPAAGIDPSYVMLAGNRALAQGLLRQASAATLRLRGAARAVLRTAWLHGNGLAVVRVTADAAELCWRPHGPPGRRALGAIVPLLPWARRYELRAQCRVRHEAGTLVLATGDPLLPGPEPRLHDSALERDFARDFAAAAPEWDLLREPVPVPLAHGLAFPDFELRHRPSGTRWLLEIAGLRDRGALPQKLALLEHLRCLLCLPEPAVPPELRGHRRVVPFRRRVDPVAVLEAARQEPPGTDTASACTRACSTAGTSPRVCS